MPRPRLSAAVLAALVLSASGCHKKTKAHNQPPPPSYSSSHKPTRPVHLGTAAGEPAASDPADTADLPPASRSAPRPDTHGHPISTEVGLASWYGPPYTHRKAADGTVYDDNAMTAAHRTLPMGSTVRVTNLTTNQSVVVRITDRGPFVNGRIIDLSLAAAKATGLYRMGVAKVRVEAFAPPARANVDPAGRWCVQVGAFPTQADALQLKYQLMRRYTTAKITEFAGPTGHWVRINPAQADRAHADQIANSIHLPDEAQPYVIRTN